MGIDGLLWPGLLALTLGAIAARRLPLVGLVVVLLIVLATALARLWLGLARPTLVDTVILIALVQLGYLVSALVPPRAKRVERPAKSVRPQDRSMS